MLLALCRFNDSNFTHFLDKGESHVCYCCTSVKPRLMFHLLNYMLQHLLFILIKLQFIKNKLITFYYFGCRKSHRKSCILCMVGNEMDNCMNAPVNSTASGIFIAEILPARHLLIACDMNSVIYQLLDSLILCSGNRHNRYAKEGLKMVYVHRAAVVLNFIHHVKGDYHRIFQLHKLHGQIHVSLNVCRINNVDNGSRFLVQNKIS